MWQEEYLVTLPSQTVKTSKTFQKSKIEQKVIFVNANYSFIPSSFITLILIETHTHINLNRTF